MSLRLKSRRNAAPNGFYYRQSETGWELTTWDFFELCRELQKHRQANPQFKLITDMTAIEDEVDAVNALRVSKIPLTESYLMEGGASPPFPVPQSRSLGQKLLNVAAGARSNLEWIRSGAPAVAPEASERRAAKCVTCPKNNSSDFTVLFTTPIAAAIKAAINLAKERKLTTSYDDRLGTCDACLCPMQVKVHRLIEDIDKYLDPVSRSLLWEKCWITQELTPNPELANSEAQPI